MSVEQFSGPEVLSGLLRNTRQDTYFWGLFNDDNLTNTLNEKKKPNTLFDCQCISKVQSNNWGHFPDQRNGGFWGKGKLEYPEKTLLEQGREPSTNSTWAQDTESRN